MVGLAAPPGFRLRPHRRCARGARRRTRRHADLPAGWNVALSTPQHLQRPQLNDPLGQWRFCNAGGHWGDRGL